MPLFTPPVVDGYPLEGDGHPLFKFYGSWAQGQTVWQDSGGVWHANAFPYLGGATYTTHDSARGATTATGPDEGLATAQKVYLGGHVHTVTDAEATALTAAGYGARINIEPQEIHWVNREDALFTRKLVSQDGTFAFTLTAVDQTGQGVAVSGTPGSTASNQREWYTHNYTEGWADSEALTYLDPVSFVPGGGINPQQGLVFRVSTVAGVHRGIAVWYDVAFGSPTIINIGVCHAPDDGSALTFRSTGFQPPLGPLATNVLPYWLGAKVTGTSMQVRAYKPNQQPVPTFGDPVWAITVDLNSFGDTGALPTPTSGASGLWVAHAGVNPISWCRFGHTYFQRND